MYYRLCAVVCFIIFLLSLYFLLAFPLCSRIVWDFLCRGGLRRAGWPGLICLVNNMIVSSACGGLNAFLIYVNYPKDGDESLWAQMEVIGGGFAIPIIKWLGIMYRCEPVYTVTGMGIDFNEWASLWACLCSHGSAMGIFVSPIIKCQGYQTTLLNTIIKKQKQKQTNKQTKTNKKQPILGSEMWTIKLQKIVGNLLNKLRKF